MEISKRIIDLRNSFGWTQYQLAVRLGTNTHSIQAWESGASNPTLDNIHKLCSVFHITPNVLLGYDPQSLLVLDDLPLEDQIILQGMYQMFYDRQRKKNR
ncbi:MAG: helix-turn-helix transcriptional regulator [Clostridia bacterium]|nr:helix-turn-helix transcriptional regulator [Clostridia bacterium]